MINPYEIFETINMISHENLDIRTITLGISLRDCAHPDMDTLCTRIYDKITTVGGNLVRTGEAIEQEYGIPIINKRISVTPIAMVAESAEGDFVKVARALDRAAKLLLADHGFVGFQGQHLVVATDYHGHAEVSDGQGKHQAKRGEDSLAGRRPGDAAKRPGGTRAHARCGIEQACVRQGKR